MIRLGNPVFVTDRKPDLHVPFGKPKVLSDVVSPPWQPPNAPEVGLTVTDRTSGAACTDNCTRAEVLAAAAWPTTTAANASATATKAATARPRARRLPFEVKPVRALIISRSLLLTAPPSK
jgi:hypothetical protein